MTPFEYVIVLVSIVLGLSITRLLSGVGEMLQARNHAKQYWVHNLWVLNVFMYNLMIWWVTYRWTTWSKGHSWNFFLFAFILLAPIVLYLLAVLLFPDEIPQAADMREHFSSIQKPFFLLFAALPIIDLADTLLKGLEHFREQNPIYLPGALLFAVGSTYAASTRRARFHATFGLTYLAFLTIYIWFNLRTLS